MSRLQLAFSKPHAIQSYGLAAVATLISLAVTYLLQDYGFRAPLFFLSIMISTWVGGIGPGMLAVALSAVFISVLNPQGIIPTSLHEIPNIIAFLITALLVGSWTKARRAAEEARGRALDELESKVRQRASDPSRMNEALGTEEEKYRSLFELSRDVIVMTDIAGQILDINPSAEQLTGYPRTELKRMNVFKDLLVKEDFELLRGILADLEKGKSRTYQYRWKAKNGATIYFEGSSVPRFSAAGEFLSTLCVLRDITERKIAEEALRKSERVLREAESLGHTGSWEQDLITGEIFNTEENLRLFFGDDRSKGEAFEDYTQIVHPDDREFVMRQRGQLLAENNPQDIEYRVVWPNGSVRWLFGRATVVRDTLGKAIRVYGTNLDITDRRLAEAALRQSESNFRILAEKSLQGIIIGQGERIMYANQAHADIYGYTIEELKSMSLEQLMALVHPEDRAFAEERARKRVAGEEDSRTFELRIIRKDGSTRWLELFNNSIEYDGIPAILSVSMDITERKRAEGAVRESKQLLDLVLASLPVGVVVTDRSGDIILANAASKRIWGKTIISGRDRWAESKGFWHESGKRIGVKEWASVRALSEGRTSLNELIDIETFDGVQKNIQNSSAPIRNAEGLIVGAVIVNEDITERMRLEDELRRSEDDLRRIVDAIPALVWSTQPDGTLDFINQTHREFTGLSLDEVRGWRWTTVIHPEDRERSVSLWRKALASGEHFETEARLRRSSGDYRWLRIRAVPLRNGGGKILKWYGTKTDVTESKQAEEHLRRNEAKLRAVFDTLPAGITILDSNGNVVEWNAAVETMLDLSTEEFRKGKYANRKFIQSDGSAISQDEFPSTMAMSQQRSVKDVEIGVVMDDGGVIWTSVSASPLPIEGLGAVVVTTSIAERKRMENELLEQKEALQDLLQQQRILSNHLQTIREEERSRMSMEIHDELGQKLTSLKIDLVWLESKLRTKSKELVQRIRAMQELTDSTVEDIQRLAIELRPGILDDLGLAAALEWQSTEFQKRTGIQCEFRGHQETADIDRNVATATFRIFQEALTNVVRHSHATKVTVRLTSDNGFINLTVSDNGRGITEAEMNHSGSLGIMSMKARAMALDGSLTIEGIPQKGTSVFVSIPPRNNTPYSP